MTGDDWAAEVAAARARYDAVATRARATSDGLMTMLRVRLSQLECRRCYGDLDAPTVAGFAAPIGRARCGCEVRCPRPPCTAPDGLVIPDCPPFPGASGP